MSREMKITVALLVLGVVVGTLYLRRLHERVLRLARPERSEEQSRREVLQPRVASPTDAKVKVKLFWASATAPMKLEPVEVEMALPADPVSRAKQILNALIADAPEPELRTLPADVTLLEFYLLEDGTAIADFSGELASNTPSGILSELLVVDSIARTLEANLPGLRRLKILIHGQETETLAGHVDLTGFFNLQSPAAETPPEKSAPGKLTASGPEVKLPR